jgi:hypothetical protein
VLDPECHGALFVPGVFGSDKTTVSVGTGNTEFYPFYGGIGNIFNSVRRAHREGLSLMSFLSIPKSMCIPTLSHPTYSPPSLQLRASTQRARNFVNFGGNYSMLPSHASSRC